MRRPNRSIEVLDISLMAVVTKAMGAFLVLMIVFMQYYSSGPIGQQTAQQITQAIEQTQKDMTEAIRRIIEKANPEDIARLLEEARRRLEEAKKLIEQLRRDNDALNAQVQRLEQENAALEKQIQQLEQKLELDKVVVTGNLVNWDCLDVKIRLGLVATDMYLNVGSRQEKNVVNSIATLGQGDARGETDFRVANPNSNATAGTATRFNNSAFRFATGPGIFGLVVVKQDSTPQRIRDFQGYALRQSQRDCTIYFTVQTAVPGNDTFLSGFTFQLVIPKDSYAYAIAEVRLLKADGAFTITAPSQAVNTWLADQIANAVKVSP